MLASASCCGFFFFNDTATTEIYTLSLHDALPISIIARGLAAELTADTIRAPARVRRTAWDRPRQRGAACGGGPPTRSVEHTSAAQSPRHLGCPPLPVTTNATQRRIRCTVSS